ncbi:hypothetical protein EKO27_g10885 [Xylaria grammica]|uniref:Xylanolytic transcriptional activator regulatory domain-containing protein n=1 Tax=Xylaria grammica TaxID=363999 RepID=A0A439CQ56_9PEZI|nr:hypothetical protein EKO27_g10885 [Xylaria grammica]
MPDENRILATRQSRTCDACKARKVRCIGGSTPEEHPLYIDQVLSDPSLKGITMSDDCLFKTDGRYLISSSLAVFSEDRLHLISRRLGHNQVRELIDSIFHSIEGRSSLAKTHTEIPASSREDSTLLERFENQAARYINAYFECIHPLYPFLDRSEFETRASHPRLIESLPNEPAFSAIYHTVLALGCQYIEDRSFDPDKGPSYELFRVALKLLPILLVSPASLPGLQAVTAMALFGMTIPGLRFEETLINEAARLAMRLDHHRVTYTGGIDSTYHRTFWVVYVIDKMGCFLYGKTTIMADYDIGCPVPETPESYLGGFNTFITLLRGCRILSKAQQLLFSVKATMNSTKQYFDSIDLIRQDLNRWVESIPPRLKPGLSVEANNAWASFAVLRLHCIHRILEISLCRLEVHVGGDACDPRLERAKLTLLNTARTVLQQTAYIELKPSTPMWLIGTIPCSSMLILFDFVIHNPSHHGTDSNLSLLDKAAGYFGRLQFASSDSVPSHVMSGFSHIALEFVRKCRLEARDINMTHGREDSETAILTPPTVDTFNTSETASQDTRRAFINRIIADMGAAEFVALPNMSEEQLFYPVAGITAGANEYPLPDFNFLDLFNPTMDHSAFPG